ncbi:LolA family protein [Streptomyces xiaopingdaonensis]|uniref:LolA family protein n=1 Tax=Streptomyces xiaopingdaonensis TaxID=1565415 RepID=UPI00031D7402|nr:hypothetical protein [Streptomyces xiaopingdaonensis]
MAQIQPSSPTPDEPQGAQRKPGRRAVRYGVPVAVVGLTAATVGLVPALADTGGPDLPDVTAEELVAKVAGAETDQLSGTVKIKTDLGLPELPGSFGSDGGGGPFGGGPGGESEAPSGEKGEGSSPAAPEGRLMQLASGEHTLRVAMDGPERQRVSLVEKAAEYNLIRNGADVWAYDSGSNSAWHTKAEPGPHGKADKGPKEGKYADLTPREAARQVLKAADGTTSVSVDGTAKVAGRDAYQLVVAPKKAEHTTVKDARISVDAETGTPLKFTLGAREGGKPVVDVAYSDVDFGKPSAGSFDFKPPKGTDVTEAKPEDHRGKQKAKPDALPDAKAFDVLGEGWGSVAELKAPGAPGAGGEDKGAGSEAEGMLDGFTEKVSGEFGDGRVVSTRVVNALLTDDGTVYVGAVTKDGLVEAANAAAKK